MFRNLQEAELAKNVITSSIFFLQSFNQSLQESIN